ncbi:hypothetical protein IAR50_006639 [Cryptococcus sp. DSM 104548]
MSSQRTQFNEGVQVSRLLQPTDEEKQRCQDVLFAGFKSNSLAYRAFSPQYPLSQSDKRRHFFHRHKIDCAAIDCETWVVKVDGEIVCVGLVVPPGKDLFDSKEKANMHEAALEQLDPAARAWFENEFLAHAAQETRFIPHRDEKRYHIQVLATHPAFGGRGLASSLLKALEEKAHREGNRLALNTSTPELARFYERCGFRQVYSTELDWQLEGMGVMTLFILVNDCGLSL